MTNLCPTAFVDLTSTLETQVIMYKHESIIRLAALKDDYDFMWLIRKLQHHYVLK